MPKFSIEHPHQLPAPEVKQRLDKMSQRLSSKYGIDAKWTSDSKATFKGTGATGTIEVAPAKVAVHVDLSFMMSPMKGQIESRIREELAKALA